ncbi:MAG: ABC transporter permease [Clostridiales bacterium]|nr:ABC transporter permease [Clostridiales bacterium]
MDTKFQKFKTSQWYGLVLLAGLLILFWGFFKILRPATFGTPDKLVLYAQTAIIYAVGGCGLYYICTMGLFDFSIGSNIVLSSVLAVTFSEKFGYAGLILAPLISGTLMGICNGIIYIKLRIPSMIVTTGLALIYESLSVFATAGSEKVLGKSYRMFGSYPWNLVLAVLAYLLCAFILKYTKIGTYTNAIGSNELVAKNMGVDVKKYKVVAFTLCGMFAGIMSILTISYGTSMTSASNMSSLGRNFTPLMGAFFGLAFKKYGHPVVAIVVGQLIISLLFNGFVVLGAPTTVQNIVTGLTLLIIVCLTTKPTKGLVVK